MRRARFGSRAPHSKTCCERTFRSATPVLAALLPWSSRGQEDAYACPAAACSGAAAPWCQEGPVDRDRPQQVDADRVRGVRRPRTGRRRGDHRADVGQQQRRRDGQRRQRRRRRLAAAGCTFKTVKATGPQARDESRREDQVQHLAAVERQPLLLAGVPGASIESAANPLQVVHNEEHGGVIIWWGDKVPAGDDRQAARVLHVQPQRRCSARRTRSSAKRSR